MRHDTCSRSGVALRWRSGSVLVLAVTLILAAVGQASAAGGEEHCVIEVVGRRVSGEFITGTERCFDTFAEAIATATHGEVLLPAGTDGSVVFTDEEIAGPLASVVIGIHYDGSGGSGASVTITGAAGSACVGGHWNTGTAWQDRISSSYNGCARLAHYALPNKGSFLENTTGVGTTKNLTVANNKVRSVSYHSS